MVSPGCAPQVAKTAALFPSAPESASIAPRITGVGRQAWTGVPITIRSYPETSI